MRFHQVQRLVVEPDLTVFQRRIVHACNGPQGRCFARTVTAQEREDFALVDVKADALHDIAFAVVGLNVPYAEVFGMGGGVVDVFVERFVHDQPP